MLRSHFLFALLAVLVLMAAPMTTARAADGVSIAVVDMEKIFNESLAAKSIIEQTKTMQAKLEKDTKALQESLNKEKQALIKKKEGMKPEDFSKEEKAFGKKFMDSRGQIQKERGAAEGALKKSWGELKQKVVDVVTEIVTEKKIQLVITKQNVVVGDINIDMTGEVMKRLDAKLKSIKVAVPK